MRATYLQVPPIAARVRRSVHLEQDNEARRTRGHLDSGALRRASDETDGGRAA